MTNNTNTSCIVGYLYTETTITIQYINGTMYHYEVSQALSKENLDQMIRLVGQGESLSSFFNSNPEIKPSEIVDKVLDVHCFKNRR